MSKLPEVIDTVDHITMQLEKAHSVLDEVCAYFVREDERAYLPIAASHINDLLHVVDDYILDATGASKSAVKKVQSMLEIEDSEDSDAIAEAKAEGAADAEYDLAADDMVEDDLSEE